MTSQWSRHLDPLDRRLTHLMERQGHRAERWLLGVIFLWFGLLKVFGQTSASSIIAESIYWFDPDWVVPFLGWWEVVIGSTLIAPRCQRLAVLLLFIRMPGTGLALMYHYDACFSGNVLTPTIQGQYLLKEISLIGAALVIGGTVRRER